MRLLEKPPKCKDRMLPLVNGRQSSMSFAERNQNSQMEGNIARILSVAPNPKGTVGTIH